jgi:hypothetical protein
MAIVKADANVENIKVNGDVITATVNLAYNDNGTDPVTELTRTRTAVIVSNASSAELAAVKSVISKAAALAVA